MIFSGKKNIKKILSNTCVALLVFLILYYANLYNFLLFHSLAELFCVIIACGMFMVAWNARHISDTPYLLFLGTAYLFVGALDLVHTLSYKGMGIFFASNGNIPTQLWIAARYMESITLLVAPLIIRFRFRPVYTFAGYAAVTGTVLAAVFYWRIFPDCFLAQAGGLTPFKIISEYVICLLLSAAAILMLLRRHRFSAGVVKWVLISIALTIAAELCFTLYASVYGFANFTGHYLKIMSFYYLYKAVIETGLANPYQLLFRELKQNRDRYESLFNNMVNGFANHEMIFDAHGRPVDYRFLEANHAFKKLTGLTDVIGKRVTQVLPGVENDPADWISVFGRVVKTGNPTRFINHSRILDRWYSVSVYSPARGQFATVFEDVTEIKTAQGNLEKSQKQFKLLSQTSDALLAADLSSPQPFADIIRQVMTQLDFDLFLFSLNTAEKEDFTLTDFQGISRKDAEAIAPLTCGPNNRKNDVRHGRLVKEDIQNSDDPETEHLRACGIQALCMLLLRVEDMRLGTLCFGTRRKSHIASDDSLIMATFSRNLSQAIHRKNVRAMLEKANSELEKRVIQRTQALEKSIQSLKWEIDKRETVEKELTHANQTLELHADQLRALTGQLTMAEQRERERLAKVLHDGLQQHLVTAKFKISGIRRHPDPDTLSDALLDVESLLGECVNMSRSLSAELSPPVLFRHGIAAALKWLGGWMKEKYEIQVHLELEANPVLDQDVRILVFESVRELVFNAVKHAGVSTVRIRLEADGDNHTTIRVSDTGRGFDPAAVINQTNTTSIETGLGLFSIQERIYLIGGRFDIESTQGNGSRFTLSIPCTRRPPGGNRPAQIAS